jgi:hypothetical protein
VSQSLGCADEHCFAMTESGDAGTGAGKTADRSPGLIAVGIERPDDDVAAGLGDEIAGEQVAQAGQVQRDAARGVAPDVQHDGSAGEVEHVAVRGFVIDTARRGGATVPGIGGFSACSAAVSAGHGPGSAPRMNGVSARPATTVEGDHCATAAAEPTWSSWK